jgi:predicted nucleic acid-binding protein
MSGFLLDTNVPSELIHVGPEPRVERWVFRQDPSELFLSVVTIGELHKGFALLPAGKRRAELEYWFHEKLLPRFRGRILPITHEIAERWGRIDAARQLLGRPLHVPDGQIAATALEHGLTLVTRNGKDFEELGLTILNPWETA